MNANSFDPNERTLHEILPDSSGCITIRLQYVSNAFVTAIDNACMMIHLTIKYVDGFSFTQFTVWPQLAKTNVKNVI